MTYETKEQVARRLAELNAEHVRRRRLEALMMVCMIAVVITWAVFT
jgi:hypothetical protein